MCLINLKKLILNPSSIILILIINLNQANALSHNLNFTNLNQKLQALDPTFLQQFSLSYSSYELQKLSDIDKGNFLFLIGKMYLYDILPNKVDFPRVGKRSYQVNQFESKSKYALAYFYILISAQKYQNGDAYYYLAVLDFIKLSPSLLVKSSIRELNRKLKKLLNFQQIKNDGLKRKIDIILDDWKEKYSLEEMTQISQYLDQISYDIQSMHLNSVQQNLFLASLSGHTKAKLTIAYLLKQGINIEKNCSTSASYYLSAIKSTVVDVFSFSLDYKEQSSFEKQLYARQKVQLKNYGHYDTSVFDNSLIFDKQTLMDYQDMALNLISGSNGFPINETLGIQILQKLKENSRIARVTLAFLYLKGKGVKKNYQKARQLFQQDGRQSNKDILLAMKFYDLGFKGERAEALKQYKTLFEKYEKKKLKVKQEKQKVQKSNLSIEEKQQRNILIDGIEKTQLENSTPLSKYMVGTLILADEIEGSKQMAKQLLEQSERRGNILAASQLAFMYLDGSFENFNCQKAVSYFYKSTIMNPVIQRRIQMGKIGIKKEKYIFSLIKYIQLMMVGFKPAYVNSVYLMKVYGQELFKFNSLSWSTHGASKNQLYKFLFSTGIVPSIESCFHKYLGLNTQGLFRPEMMDLLTGPENINGSILQYEQYMIQKASRIGISKHQISILLFLKYKETEDFSILQKLVEIAQDRPHIYESQFLLGRYYQHYRASRSERERRNKKAIQYYSKAAKNKFLGKLAFLIEGGEWKEDQIIFSHLLWFLTILLVIFIFLYRKKNKNIEQLLIAEGLKGKQEDQTAEEVEIKEKQNLKPDDLTGTHRNIQKQENKRVEQYERPKFSQQQQQNVKSQSSLMKIKIMLEQRKKNEQAFDRDQPIIIDEDEEQELQRF